jgi:hypothetical protein
LTFVCQWPAQDIPETRTEIDAQFLLDAAGRSVQVWQEEPGAPDELTLRLTAWLGEPARARLRRAASPPRLTRRS